MECFPKNKLYKRTVQHQEVDKKQFKICTTLTGFQTALENIRGEKPAFLFSATVLSRKMSMSQLAIFLYIKKNPTPYFCYSYEEKLILKSTISLPVVVFHPLTTSANFYIFPIHH